MSGELFGRSALLKVGPSANKTSKSLEIANPIIFKGLRIAFQIGKTSESNPNTSRIEIYNLSSESRTKLEQVDLKLELEVGYSGLGSSPTLSQIFTGDIKRVMSERRGSDIVTVFESGDSENTIRTAKIEETFAPNTTTDTVISALAKKLGVAIGTIAPGIAGIFQNGLSLSGLASQHLDNLTKQAGLEWSIQDGELNILEPSQPTPESAVYVSPRTGLIGIPSKTESGYQFQSLINPLIKPGRAISLVSSNISGLMKAKRCEYEGDTHGDKWLVTVEAV